MKRREYAMIQTSRLLAAGLLGVLVLAGCSSPPEGGSSDKMTGGDKMTSGGGAKGSDAKGGKKIAILSPAKTSEFHNELPKGAAEEAKTLGWPDIIDQAPQKEDDYAGQVSLAEDILQKRPDAVSVCGINPQALDEIIQKANDAKIPIFVHNQITPVKGTVVAYIGYDEREGGKLCGEKAAELLKAKNGDYKGEIAILDGEPGDHTNERAGGFKDALKKYPNIKIDAEQNGKWSLETGTSTTKDWLQRFPKLDLVFGCSDAMAQGAAEAGEQQNHKLLTLGIDGNKSTLKDIQDGKVTATLAVQPQKIGAKIVDVMNDYFQGKNTATGQVVKTDMKIVTKDNVGEFIKP